MTRARQLAFGWLAFFVVLCALLFFFRQIILPFAAGAIIAYALDPAAHTLQRWGLNRFWATFLLVILGVVIVILFLLVLVPLLINQTIDFLGGLPGYVTRLQELTSGALDSDWARFLGIDADSIRASLTAFMSRGVGLATTVLGSVWTGGRVVFDVITLIVLTPFVTFYMLRDWDMIVDRVDRLLPRDQIGEIHEIAREIDHKVAAFVRGQMLVGTLLGMFYAAGLLIVGLNYGLLIGLASGILSFIPYLGFGVGFVLSIIIALVQFWPDWIWIAATIVVFMLGQVLEGYILQPRFLAQRVGLHPVWLFFALFAFGMVFGFVGLIIAVPGAAAIGVVLRHLIDRYRASEYYRGSGPKGRA